MQIDLTPFGYTPTESAAYMKLLERGPSSGYALAKDLGIARANAYQALDGLVSKGAAVAGGGQPRHYRAVRPDAVLALVTKRAAERLDALEAAVRETAHPGAATTVAVASERSLRELATRLIAREEAPVTCLAPSSFLADTAPVWRKRAADGLGTAIWVIGEDPVHPALAVAGRVDAERIHRWFPAAIAMLAGGSQALSVAFIGPDTAGFWSSDLLTIGLVHAALAELTSGA